MIDNPFLMNSNADVQKIDLPYYDRYYWQIDNFYADPKAVNEYLDTQCQYTLFKEGEPGSLNGKKFADRRHTGIHVGMEGVAFTLAKICGAREYKNEGNTILTNTFTILDPEFDKHETHWWWPHLDHGWTVLIYLNEEACEGTNLYHRDGFPKMIAQHGFDSAVRTGAERNSEHTGPWSPKESWIRGANMPSKFNRAVIFPSLIYHGMAIDSKRWHNEVRRNQVFFYHY